MFNIESIENEFDWTETSLSYMVNFMEQGYHKQIFLIIYKNSKTAS